MNWRKPSNVQKEQPPVNMTYTCNTVVVQKSQLHRYKMYKAFYFNFAVFEKKPYS